MGLRLFVVGLLFPLLSYGQLSDSAYVHNRNKAALFSTVIPGVGSFYNEYGHRKVQNRKNISWWRAPIYWAGIGFTAYLAQKNAVEARRLKKEWLYRADFPNAYWHDEYKLISTDELIQGSDTFYGFEERSQYRDYAIAGVVLVYGINIVDAFVDAHFVSFDVSKDLSMQFKPRYFGQQNLGLALTLNFK